MSVTTDSCVSTSRCNRLRENTTTIPARQSSHRPDESTTFHIVYQLQQCGRQSHPVADARSRRGAEHVPTVTLMHCDTHMRPLSTPPRTFTSTVSRLFTHHIIYKIPDQFNRNSAARGPSAPCRGPNIRWIYQLDFAGKHPTYLMKPTYATVYYEAKV